MSSMYNEIMPLIVRYDPKAAELLFVRISGNPHETLQAIERVTKEVNPAFPFRYSIRG
ncbi:MAG: hypothetical protein WDO15_08605 [Bacteroidota bacterium]